MGRIKRWKKKQNKNEERKGIKNLDSYVDVTLGNPDFETYYKLQKICSEDEWETLIQCLKTDLPAAFRITNFKSEAKLLLKIVEGKYFKEILSRKDENVKLVALSWYPDQLAWQFKLSRRDIRRSESLFQLHNFLISETDSGSISRQEVVSMIPPLVLDIQSHHKIMDMCAAPGSKTAQLIELLHQNQDNMPTGFVIANDMDNNRCYMLVHQAKRLNSPNIIITNHDSTIMPNFMVSDSDDKECVLKFDRILCDVPCSGDGTLRKNPDIWAKWNSANANNLHGIQYRIVKRGVEMLAIGGRLVYSTCSLNPIENEAVLARLLQEADGALKLVDVSNRLPGLKYQPGMKHWAVTSKDLKIFERFEDVPESSRTLIRPYMFPPQSKLADELNLQYCIRILPHYQDTGGFFVAALEKVSKLPWEAKGPSSDVKSEEKTKEPSRKKRRMFGYREDPFIFFENSEPIWQDIKNFYGFHENFPNLCLLTRCAEGKKKNVYLTSPNVRDVVMKNANHVKIINTGVKTFARCDSKEMKCPFRLVQEGLWSILPFMTKQRHVEVIKDDLVAMLSCQDLKQPILQESLSDVTKNQIALLGHGSCVLVYHDLLEDLTLSLVGWIGAISVRAYVSQSDAVHYLRLLGADTSKFEKNKFKEKESV